MNTLLISILILFMLLLGLLAVPLSLSYSINRDLKQLQGNARIRWLFGLVNFQTHFPVASSAAIDDRHKPKNKTETKKSNNNNFVSLFKHKQFRKHSIQFIKKLLRACHARNLFLKLRIGLGDPADTGMLWSIMGPISGMLKNLQGININIQPEFMDETLAIESHGNFRFIPLQFIALLSAFLLSPITIRAWQKSRK